MNIAILGDLFTFPEGHAATNRIHSLVDGLRANGAVVTVICFRNDYGKEDGTFNEHPFFYPFQSKNRSSWFFIRQFFKLKKLWNTIGVLNLIKNKSAIDAIIEYSDKTTTHCLAYFFTKLFGARFLLLQDEHPLRDLHFGIQNKIEGTLRLLFIYKLYDGIACITDSLMQSFPRWKRKNADLFLLPSTIDLSRFAIETTSPFPFDYIGYFGGISIDRDALDVLLQAFNNLINEYPDLHLVVTGRSNTRKDKEDVYELVANLNARNHIHIIENLSRDEVVHYVQHAKVLAMVRRNDFRAEASFPSKLLEYLATGKPIISVRVGEISKYLRDNENIFLVEPDDYEAFAQKLKFVLTNYDHALQVGLHGKTVAASFDNIIQTQRLITFINSLNKK